MANWNRWFTCVYLLKMVIFHGYVSHNQRVSGFNFLQVPSRAPPGKRPPRKSLLVVDLPATLEKRHGHGHGQKPHPVLESSGGWNGQWKTLWWLTVLHGFSMAPIEIIRWFTELNSMVDLSMANWQCHNQMVSQFIRERQWKSQCGKNPGKSHGKTQNFFQATCRPYQRYEVTDVFHPLLLLPTDSSSWAAPQENTPLAGEEWENDGILGTPKIDQHR